MTLNTSRPFTRADALAVGITVGELAGPKFVRLFHGVYVKASVPVTAKIRALAALRVSDPGSWVSHHTAGTLWGGWMPKTSDTHVSAPNPDRRSIRRGIYTHRARPGSQPTKRFGVALAPPIEVFLDLAALHLDLVDLVVAGDSLVQATSIEPKDLSGVTAEWFGRGSRLARWAASYVRTGVDSAQETRLRMLLVLAGLPEPVVNRITRHENGEWKWRFDLCYPDLKILIEYDGEHHDGKAQQKLDEARRAAIAREGWLVIVVTRDDLSRDPGGVLERIQQALQERGCTGLPRRFKTAWQRHFPVHASAA